MNKEQTAERIKVMQAFVNGKQIQHWSAPRNEWVDCHPMWGRNTQYRIKPDPREWRIAVRKSDGHIELMDEFGEVNELWEVVNVREILE